jgi:ABC-type transport system involved in multi-copper enzyme maturation permease subunit
MTAIDVTNPPVAPQVGRQGFGSWLAGLWLVVGLELKQRIRSTKWKAALLTVTVLIALVTGLIVLAARAGSSEDGSEGDWVFGLVVFFVLFLGLIISPTLSATAINGDAKEGTLAPLQATGLGASQIVVGKLLAAWAASLSFVVVAIPFLAFAYINSDANPWAMATVVLVLAVELLVVCALGLGWSALTPRTAASAVLTYVTVAVLTVVLPVMFGLLAATFTKEVEVNSSWREYVYTEGGAPIPGDAVKDEYGEYYVCRKQSYTTTMPRTEATWWMLAVNPYVIVADSAPLPPRGNAEYWDGGMLGSIKQGVRELRLGLNSSGDNCAVGETQQEVDRRERLDSLSPVWPWGIAVQAALATVSVWVAIRRVRVPYGKLTSGTRVA